MKNQVTVLFTSAGRRNQLIDCFRRSASTMRLGMRVLAADMAPELSSACHTADAHFKVPRCTSSEYVPSLLDLCEREGVDLVVPTIDTELASLSAASEEFAGQSTVVLVSSPEVVSLAGNKLATATLLAAHGLSVPRTLPLREYLAEPLKLPFPVIAKPNSGSASAGILRPSKPEDLTGLPVDQYIVQQLCSGREYTVNLFFDAGGILRCAIPHLRIEVRSGEVSKGRTEQVPALAAVARRLAPLLPGAIGPLCFQAFVSDEGGCSVFEINARFGGGYPLSDHAGATMARWILEQLTGRPCTAHDNWRPGVTMLRFDDAVFLDG